MVRMSWPPSIRWGCKRMAECVVTRRIPPPGRLRVHLVQSAHFIEMALQCPDLALGHRKTRSLPPLPSPDGSGRPALRSHRSPVDGAGLGSAETASSTAPRSSQCCGRRGAPAAPRARAGSGRGAGFVGQRLISDSLASRFPTLGIRLLQGHGQADHLR
jgi:hypothetical protein